MEYKQEDTADASPLLRRFEIFSIFRQLFHFSTTCFGGILDLASIRYSVELTVPNAFRVWFACPCRFHFNVPRNSIFIL